MTVKGIDISYANRNLDFAKIKVAGVSFAIIRTGYRQHTDDMFHSHMKNALAAGLDVGAYCYCMATTPAEARKEAEYAVNLLKPYKISYPLFYDMEDATISDLSKTKLTNIAIAFLETAENLGYRAGLYANPSWLENKVNREKILSKYDLWLAHWTGSPDTPTKYQYGQKMWQWGAGNLSGISGKIDGDVCYVDYPALIGAEDDDQQGGGEQPFTPIVGDVVLFGGGKHYGASAMTQPTGGIRTAGTAKVTNVAVNTPHPYHLVGVSSNVYGWVDSDAVFALSSGEVKKAAVVVNLRSKAGFDGDVLVTIPGGADVVMFPETAKKDGITWQKAAYNGFTGYLNSDFIAK